MNLDSPTAGQALGGPHAKEFTTAMEREYDSLEAKGT
jgi:hypothetical protein